MDILIHWDEEAKGWVAECDDLGLATESEHYNTLIAKVKAAIPELLKLNNINSVKEFVLCTEKQMVYA